MRPRGAVVLFCALEESEINFVFASLCSCDPMRWNLSAFAWCPVYDLNRIGPVCNIVVSNGRLPVLDALVIFVNFTGEQNDHGKRAKAANQDIRHYELTSFAVLCPGPLRPS